MGLLGLHGLWMGMWCERSMVVALLLDRIGGREPIVMVLHSRSSLLSRRDVCILCPIICRSPSRICSIGVWLGLQLRLPVLLGRILRIGQLRIVNLSIYIVLFGLGLVYVWLIRLI